MKSELLLAIDCLHNKLIAGAIVSSESESESTFFLQTLKAWLPKPVKFITIDFPIRIEAGVKTAFPKVTIQKCIFHTTQLFLRGLMKELIKVKNEQYLDHIHEWNQLRNISNTVEKSQDHEPVLELKFKDTSYAWRLY